MGNEELIALYQQQLRDFELAHTNYQHLAKVICRDIPCGHFSIRIQYNPARMLSTNANTDKATLQARKCFLCPAQMPAEQKGIPYGEHYHLFINPYPIFDPHFTVPANEHTPQLLEKRFGDLLNLAFDFPGYTLFYNGPDCGASAPDHFHFQMIPRNSMPLEEDVNNELLLREIVRQDYYSISVLDNYLRKIILLKASDSRLLIPLFARLSNIIGQEIPYESEPMVNVLAWFDNCQWTVCIFPRRIRRPWQFFATGDDKTLFSPGCVDMAGLIVAPRQEDFEKYSAGLLADLFRQVTADDASWDRIVAQIEKLN